MSTAYSLRQTPKGYLGYAIFTNPESADAQEFGMRASVAMRIIAINAFKVDRTNADTIHLEADDDELVIKIGHSVEERRFAEALVHQSGGTAVLEDNEIRFRDKSTLLENSIDLVPAVNNLIQAHGLNTCVEAAFGKLRPLGLGNGGRAN